MVKTAGPLFGPNVSGPIKRRVRKTYPTANPPSYNLEVTGTLTPDITGPYHQYGTYNGKPSYKHHTLAWFIWWHFEDPPGVNVWSITQALGSSPDEHWNKSSGAYEAPAGDYTAAGGAVGTATVAVP